MKYKIGDMAKLTGINPQTIRRYDDAGIIRSDRDENTGFRSYDPAELAVLMHARFYRKFGFSLDEISALIHSDPTDNLQMFHRKRARLEYEQLLADCRLEAINEQLRFLEEAALTSQPCCLATRPAMVGILFRSGFSLMEREDLPTEAAKWMDYAPMTRSLSLYDPDYFKDPSHFYRSGSQIGLCIPLKYVKLLDIPQDKNSFLIPEVKAVRAIYHASGAGYSPALRESYDTVAAFLEQNQLEPCGAPMLIPFYCRRERDGHHYIAHMWVPVK